MGAFRLPPVDNLLRALPVLDVTDNRRLTLWVAFALALLGGIGLDQLASSGRLARWWIMAWLLGAVVLAVAGLAQSARSRAGSGERALAHYRDAAAATAGGRSAKLIEQRAERQVRQVLDFCRATMGWSPSSSPCWPRLLCNCAAAGEHTVDSPGVLGLVLSIWPGSGFGLNPAIAAEDTRVRAAGDRQAAQERMPAGRALGLGEELPPNVLMRFGLPTSAITTRSSSREACAGLRRSTTEPAPITSRSEITWERVRGQSRLLRESGVDAVVAAAPPPEGASCGSSRSAESGSPGSTGCRGPLPSSPGAGSRSLATTAGLEFESIPTRPRA